MISVLLPARGRPERLADSIALLAKSASKPEEIEYLIRTDDDEPPSLPKLMEGLGLLGRLVRELRGPRHGYSGMHFYFNQCAAEARGTHFLIWNDDLDMKTVAWDTLLSSGTGLVQFPRRDIFSTADDSIPFVHRKVFEALGHLSQHCFVDTWLSRVAMAAGVREFRNDVVFHHHRLQDETSAGREAVMKVEYPRFQTLGCEQWADVEKLRGALKRQYV